MNKNPYILAGWKKTMARRALAKMAASPTCPRCGGIGFILDPAQRPMDRPCPECSGDKTKT